MILDSSLLFDNAAAITVTRDSTNIIDLVNARDLGGSDDLRLFVQVVTTFTAGGAGTLSIAVAGSPDNSTYYVIEQSQTLALANLVSGRRLLDIGFPRNQAYGNAPGMLFRYYKLVYTVGTGPMTAGVVTAGINIDTSLPVQYPRNYTVNN